MTAKEKLRKAGEELSEAEAEEALHLLVHRHEAAEPDPMIEFLDNAPIDDEPESADEREASLKAARRFAAATPSASTRSTPTALERLEGRADRSRQTGPAPARRPG